MGIRKLRKEDAPFMLEWMHDDDVTHYMKTNFSSRTLGDCEEFIRNSQDQTIDAHFAVTNEADEYLGTVSLKHIQNKSAEFAITMRKKAMGTGAANNGMKLVLEHGFSALGLNNIYWCVNPENQRAVRFYEKATYQRIELGLLYKILGNTFADFLDRGRYQRVEAENYFWYLVRQ